MNGGEIIGFAAVLGIIVIPSLGLTARFALKPIVESVLRLREALDRDRPVHENERLTRLEERVSMLSDTVDRLADSVDFHMQLQAGTRAPGGESALPPAVEAAVASPAGPALS